MEKDIFKPESSKQIILPEDKQQLNDVLIYEKWRDDGKYDHKKRDIEKKLKKLNAVIKDRKGLNTNEKPPFEQ